MLKSPALCAGLLASCLAFPGAAAADPLVITSGSLTLNEFQTYAPFAFLTTNGTSISGQWPNGVDAPGVAGHVNPGSTFSYDAVPFVFGDPFATGKIVTNDGTFTGFLMGDLTFTGSDTAIPAFPVTAETQLFSLTAPFSFTGNVSLYDRLIDGPFELTPLVTLALSGQGLARVDLIGDNASGTPRFTRYRTVYDFSSSQTPEPATVLLLTTGAAMLYRRRSREGGMLRG